MIETLIRLLLESTLIGIVVISFILILRFAFHFSLSAKVKYYIWIVALIALLIPIRIDIPAVSKVSEPIKQQTAETVMAFVNPPKHISIMQPNQPGKKPPQNIKDPNKNVSNTIGQTIPDESTNTVVQDTTATTVAPISPWIIAFIIWAIGVLIYLAWITLGFIFFRKSLKDIRPFDDNEANDILEECKSRLKVRKNISIYLSSSISTPLLMGVFRSRILLPSTNYNENELRYILTHELIHFKRRDLWYKCLFVLTNAVHWFNPLVYFMHRKLNEDCELSCDEKLIKGLTDEERNSYGNILLNNIYRQNGYQVNMTTAMNNSKKSLKKRLNEIVSYKRPNKFVFLISIVFVTVILVVFSLMLSACNSGVATLKASSPVIEQTTPSPTLETLFDAAQRLAWDYNLCEDSNDVYYKNNIGIWKYNKSTCQESLIIKGKNVCYIVLSGSKLYFMSYEKWEDKRIYELDIDGTKRLICAVDDYVQDGEIAQEYFFVNNNVFYIPYFRGGLIKYVPESGKAFVFNNDVGSFGFLGDKFYNTGFRKEVYQMKDFVSETNLITGEKKQLYTTKKGASSQMDLTVFNNELYIANEYNQLCKYITGKGIDKLQDLSVVPEIMDIVFPDECKNNKLYYIVRKFDKPCSLYVYNPSTNENKIKIDDFDCENGYFSIFHNALIYFNGKDKIKYISLE